MERDGFWELGILNAKKISTHTLTWSVTVGVTQAVKDIFISTHTLTWSVTLSLPPSQNFLAISTHTLTWSVTPI